jgi:hypothetical protein
VQKVWIWTQNIKSDWQMYYSWIEITEHINIGPCLDELQKLEFFHSLSITSIFGRMHGAVNVDKK